MTTEDPKWTKKEIAFLAPYTKGAPTAQAALLFAHHQVLVLVEIWKAYERGNIETAAHYREHFQDEAMGRRFDAYAKEKAKKWKWFDRLAAKMDLHGIPDELKPAHERT